MPIPFPRIWTHRPNRTGKSPKPCADPPRMADKGLVMDFEHRVKFSYILSPTVIGFFEFACSLRFEADLPLRRRFAKHMVAYAHDGAPTSARAVSPKNTAGADAHPRRRGGSADLTQIST